MTVTSSVTKVGTIFQGVIVKTRTTEIAAAKITRNFSCGDFFVIVCCNFPHCILYFRSYKGQGVFDSSANENIIKIKLLET